MLKNILPFIIISSLIGPSCLHNVKSNLKDGKTYNINLRNYEKTLSTNSNINFNEFKNSYFYNLTQNYSENENSSCGYVAIGMLLSYYDTYLSDDIIPELYDSPSIGSSSNMIKRMDCPGVRNDKLNISDAKEYYDKITKLENPSFQGKIMQIAKNKNILNLNNKKPFTTYFEDRIIILNEYFQNVLGYEYGKEYSLNYTTNNVRDFTISQIKQGNPVMLSLYFKNTDEGHVVIAYDYDNANDILYCHTGWVNTFPNYNYYDVDYLFGPYKGALVIGFNLNHSHSNNYKVNNKAYCFNDCNIYTYDGTNKEHHYNKYEQYSATKHKYICINNDGYILRGHAVDSSKIYTSNGHMYGNCIDCNYLVDLGSTSVITPSNNLFISKNGSYMLENGIYIIQKEDLEAYLNGTLIDKNIEEN